MKIFHLLLLTLLAAIWGFNFVPIRVGLDHVPPLTFATMRYLFTILPAVFFVKKPQEVSYRRLALFGAVLFTGQFGFVFAGIHAGLAAGLASLIMQTQAFFTIGLAAFVLREKPLLFQMIGALVAGTGIALVAMHVGGEVTPLGLGLVLFAAFSWGCGNLIAKTFDKTHMLGAIVWGNLFAFIFMLPIAIFVDGVNGVVQGYSNLNVPTIMSLLYISYLSTIVGYSIWCFMLAHYPAAAVVPFTFMVPIFAMLSTSIFLGESLSPWKFEAAGLILTGLVLNQFGANLISWIRRFGKPAPASD